MKTKGRKLLDTIICEIIPENLGKIHQYYTREVCEAAIWKMIEANECMQRALQHVASDNCLNAENKVLLFQATVLEVKCVQKSIYGYLYCLQKKYNLRQFNFLIYRNRLDEISAPNGLLCQLCKLSARRVTELQNMLRVIGTDEEKIVEHLY